MQYPQYRPRRLRRNENLRRLIRETRLSVDNFIYPLFVRTGNNLKEEISSMPNTYRFSLDRLLLELEEITNLEIPAVILFGIPETKDEEGSEAYNPQGIIPSAVRKIKREFPELIVMTDVCIDEYTSHGHCGVVRGNEILNDPTLDILARMALIHAEAGADLVAPSDMMDGRIGVIRKRLDDNGFSKVGIMSYAAKYASAFYGPFRDAADSAPRFGDRKSYQMDSPNRREAIREIELDIKEGADIVMVKPALAYLDVISRAKERFDFPLAAYNVSGEYALVKAAAKEGWIEEEKIVMEILLSIKRAGADMILTYFAKDAARILK